MTKSGTKPDHLRRRRQVQANCKQRSETTPLNRKLRIQADRRLDAAKPSHANQPTDAKQRYHPAASLVSVAVGGKGRRTRASVTQWKRYQWHSVTRRTNRRTQRNCSGRVVSLSSDQLA